MSQSLYLTLEYWHPKREGDFNLCSGIGTKCVEFENVMKSATKKNLHLIPYY